MTKAQGITWEQWLEELRKINQCVGESLGKDNELEKLDYQEYWETNQTPADCVKEILSYA